MNGEERILRFLQEQRDITFGYSELIFVPAASLIAEKKDNWPSNWTVIANDETGDPIFIDTATPELRVLTAAHSTGGWKAEPIADSLDSFAGILGELRLLATGRANPVEKLLNPLLAREAHAFLEFVKTTNPQTDPAHWETLMLLALENDTE